MTRIYFDEQVLMITTSNAEMKGQQHEVLLSKGTPVSEMLHSITAAARGTRFLLIAENETEILNKIKAQYLVIQAGGGLVYTPNQHVLLIFRRGKWDLPKGKVDEGESIEACAVREVAEETGVHNLTLGHHLLTTYHTYKEKGKAILKESHWFLMSATEATRLTPQVEEDIEECVWAPANSVVDYQAQAHASVADVLQIGLPLLRHTNWPILSPA